MKDDEDNENEDEDENEEDKVKSKNKNLDEDENEEEEETDEDEEVDGKSSNETSEAETASESETEVRIHSILKLVKTKPIEKKTKQKPSLFAYIKDTTNEKKKINLEPRVKKHEGRLTAIKKCNVLLQATVDNLQDEITQIRSKSTNMQAELDAILADLGF